MKKVFSLIFVLLVLYACVEPFDFKVKDTETVLVVDAVLTSELKIQTVQLSVSYALDENVPAPYSGATVWVEDENGQKVIFKEDGTSGTYQTTTEYAAVPGQSYVLHFTTADGEEFTSSKETVPKPVPIDSIYGRYIEKNSTQDSRQLKGVQFFVDNHNFDESFSNYRYDYVEDYQINVIYPSVYEWDAMNDTLLYREISIASCYNRIVSDELLAETTSGLSENRLSEFPLVYIEDIDAQLRSNFSLTVNQYAITPSAYQYYKNLKENNESSGSFFDKQKGTVLGNISNVRDAGYPVLGYFEVSGVSSGYRIFASGAFRDQGFSPSMSYECIYDRIADTVAIAELNTYVGLGTGYEVIRLVDPELVDAIIMPSRCSDCRHYGSLDKPDFWNP
ncbi:DUF4249 domain-containing protein [Reichenbachiella agarivorans]|uniref:DUF4249 domain-containing protein n=1 Tax=Reichenbachiella agarivorans TaxID=2979464 RepID=A0ABY6CPH7_9BACT|nr:DUF4249 domain-containing protein [Reichenbachiella agarivorans]UXP32417.1 DUF4249 domain-containing protein [Reichenbachiella agarivorans]